MPKLKHNEVFLLVIVANLLAYVLGYQIIVNPMLSLVDSAKTEYVKAQDEHDKILQEIENDKVYLKNIADLLEARKELYQKNFPDAETEVVHAFLNQESQKVGLQLKSVKITPIQETSTTESGEEVKSIFKNNDVLIDVQGSYSQITDFLKNIEGLERTSAVKGLNMEGNSENMTVSIELEMLTVQKEDKDDTIFEHSFGGSKGGTMLQIR